MAALRYPNNVDDPGSPYVTFQFYEVLAGGERRSSGASSVVLFMPPAFQITDSQDYEFAQKGLLGQIFGAAEGGLEGIGRGIVSLLRKTKLFGDDYAQGSAALGLAVRDPKFFNYKEPKPREFTFTYKFEPKNQQDAQSMLQIINTFRYASYPSALAGGQMYKVPDSVTMTLANVQTGLEDQLGNLVIKDINTTLSEGEQMVTFSDGIPTQVSLQIVFAETSLMQKDNGRLGPQIETGSGVQIPPDGG